MNNAAPARRNLIVVGAIVAVLALVVGVGWAIQANRDTTGDPAKNPGGNAEAWKDADVVAPVDTYGIGVGSPDAAAKVEIFVDFQCPHCADFEDASKEKLRGLAAEGDAFVVYRPMAFINEYSVLAMNAFGAVMDSGDAEAALALHDLFFEEQPAGDLPGEEWYVEQAAAVGADSEEVAAAIEGYDFEQWIVNATDDASKRGVTGTPAVFVNGKAVEAKTIEEMLDTTVELVEAAQ